MKKLTVAIVALIAALSVQAQDESGCKDHPLFNRMPHTTITECSSRFDQMDFYENDENNVTKEGMKTILKYDYNDGTDNDNSAPSFLQIVKNYENAITKKGGKRLYFSNDDRATLYLKTGGKEVWIDMICANHLGSNQGSYQLTILEIEEMKQDIEANAIFDSLNKNGHIALYINFETGKSAIQTESQKTIDEIVLMLKANPLIKVSIEGHTDNVGQVAANQKLSTDRAISVVNAVVTGGIDKTRLEAKGWGQTKSIADNKTEEGRALNRRVEIVKK